MTQRQSDMRAVKALLLAAEGGNPGEDSAQLSERATVALHRLCRQVQEAERRRRAARAPYAATPEEHFTLGFHPHQQPLRQHIGRGCMEDA